jgi:hypothetical protein
MMSNPARNAVMLLLMLLILLCMSGSSHANTSIPTIFQPKVPDDATATANSGIDPAQFARQLHQAVQQKNWPKVQQLLPSYQQLANADPFLLSYAHGALARAQGDLAGAQRHFTALVRQQPDVLSAKLELARVHFEQQHQREALQLFSEIITALPEDAAHAAGVRQTVAGYLASLTTQQRWQGQVTLATGYDSNLNLSSESYACLLPLPDNQCLLERSVPTAEGAITTSLNASAQRHWALQQSHGVLAEFSTEQQFFHDHSEFNLHNFSGRAGYSYRSANIQWQLTPSWQQQWFGQQPLLHAAGMQSQWQHMLDHDSLVRLNAEYQQLVFQPERLRYQSDSLRSLSVHYLLQLNPQWLLFSGLTLQQQQNKLAEHASQSQLSTLGLSRQWPSGIEASLLWQFGQRQYRGFSAVLAAKRRDLQQEVMFQLQGPALGKLPLFPLFKAQYRQVRSNIDWLYSYQQTQFTLQLDYRF